MYFTAQVLIFIEVELGDTGVDRRENSGKNIIDGP